MPPSERGEIVLGHRRVYIVPSRLGLFFGGALVILLVGSINYALALGFALTFLLAGMGIAAMVQTTRNLARLSVRAGRSDAVFAGDAARFRLAMANAGDFDRPEILLRHYLNIENGDYFRALGRYNGSLGKADYPNTVVRAWISNWKYPVRAASTTAR